MNPDLRGCFTEVHHAAHNSDVNFVQWSIVQSKPQVFRGMHYHKRHAECFCMVAGKCLVGLKDLRPESSTFLRTALYQLDGQDLSSVYFPAGILHGWYFVENSTHLQGVSESYKSYAEDDNHGCIWNDPDLDIDWPFSAVITSERASTFGRLSDILGIIEEPFSK